MVLADIPSTLFKLIMKFERLLAHRLPHANAQSRRYVCVLLCTLCDQKALVCATNGATSFKYSLLAMRSWANKHQKKCPAS
ncbi:hypothetical protein LF95_08865 [Thalassospira sp. TSL5-1]|nr:hypothetical protein LF95_08865 [Thalassospira sp. TSL5-1]